MCGPKSVRFATLRDAAVGQQGGRGGDAAGNAGGGRIVEVWPGSIADQLRGGYRAQGMPIDAAMMHEDDSSPKRPARSDSSTRLGWWGRRLSGPQIQARVSSTLSVCVCALPQAHLWHPHRNNAKLRTADAISKHQQTN